MKKLFNEFKKFISRGNVLDMAVGVVIGSAFSAIVTSVVNILLSICTWAVPGGLKGLVTVLPAVNSTQEGLAGIGQKFAASDLQALATQIAEQNYANQIANDPNYLANNPNLIESAKTFLTSKYTLHGNTYTYNLSSVIDWGAFINAVISFLIVAITLFIIVKVAKTSAAKRAQLKNIESRVKLKEEKGIPLTKKEKAVLEKMKEAELAAKKEAEEAAAKASQPAVPTPSEALLAEIRDLLKAQK